jgi:hypothetical protein
MGNGSPAGHGNTTPENPEKTEVVLPLPAQRAGKTLLGTIALLAQAKAAGLQVQAERGQVRIRGPRTADALARHLLDQKADVLLVLTAEQRAAQLVQKARTATPDGSGFPDDPVERAKWNRLRDQIDAAWEQGDHAAVQAACDAFEDAIDVYLAQDGDAEPENLVLPDGHRVVVFQRDPFLESYLRQVHAGTPPPPAPPTWSQEMTDLITWFTAAAGQLPQEPFALSPCAMVDDPARFYVALNVDITTGPAGARARTGALQQDLRRLRQLFGTSEDAHAR